MSTRSIIIRRLDADTLEALACHWDGYPEHVGRVLHEHYSDPERIEKLFQLGEIESLQPKLEETTQTDRARDGEVTPGKFGSLDDVRDQYFFEQAYLWDGEKWLASHALCVKHMAPVSDLLQELADERPSCADWDTDQSW